MDIGQYRIEHVPIDEALRLRAAGVVMYDYTKLTAANTCPTWGVLRYGLHKTEFPLTEGGRSTALECGSACHDYFAALRMWTLMRDSGEHETGLAYDAGLLQYGNKLFGRERMQSMLEVPQDSDRINNAMMFALDALHTSGYYDDPNDTKRTMSNMESSCLAYTDRYFKSNMPVYVRSDLIGVEIPFVIRVTDTHSDREVHYCGKIDGIHEWNDTVIVAENKTASRLSDSWRMSFAISHQVTGYMVAAECIFALPINNAIVMGVQIPPPRDIFSAVSFELCTRTSSDKLRWCEWVFHSVNTYHMYLDAPQDAPRYSHSCNRFFSACMYIPYCTLPREDQVSALADMSVDEWSPLDHVVEKVIEGE